MTEQISDFAALMRQVQEGNPQAAEELHSVYGRYIRQAVRKRLDKKLRSKFDSLDFVQDVWASFFSDIPKKYSFATPEDLVGFVTTMAHHKVADAVRTRLHRQKYNVNREEGLDHMPGGLASFPAVQATPSEVAMGREEWARFLAKQPLAYRRILLLLREGKTSATIAEELGISQRTVNRVLRKVMPGTPS